MIISHLDEEYREKWNRMNGNRFNGAFYYSQEIIRNIYPRVSTTRNWVTINIPGACADHSIVFIHSNLNADRYDWLTNYSDIILVCGIESTCDKVKHLGTPIYLPLSVDVEYVSQFKANSRTGTAFAGRVNKRGAEFTDGLPEDIHFIEGMPRKQMLRTMARYEYIYAVGRTAIEAKALGCKVLPYDHRYPDPELWQVLDNREAAKLLQIELNKIDGRKKMEAEWNSGFPEKRGLYECLVDGKKMLLVHHHCLSNDRSWWSMTNGYDVVGTSIKWKGNPVNLADGK